jgi:glycosyltransferase involved in cell wall biosynthesis
VRPLYAGHAVAEGRNLFVTTLVVRAPRRVERVRVLHIIPSVSCLRGGPSVAVRAIARGLVNRGVAVDIATTDDHGTDRLVVPLDQPVVEEGVTYRYFRRQTGFYTVSWPLSRWLAVHVEEYDVLHIHALFSFSATAAAFWAARRGVPYVVRPLGVLNTWGMQNRRPLLKQLSFRLIERRILANAAAVHFTSEQERCEAELTAPGIRSVVIPNPVASRSANEKPSTEPFVARHPDLAGRRVILFLSRLDPIKGLDLLLNAFPRIRSAVPDAALVVAGNGEDRFLARLRDQAQRLGVQQDVVWAGFLDESTKRAAFAAADVFVLPSYSENFGIAAVEAMANGLPVIVSDRVGIHREVARAKAGLVVRCDADEVSGAVVQILSDCEARSQMARNAVLIAKEFSPEIVSDTLVEAYRGVSRKSAVIDSSAAPIVSAIVLTYNEEQNLPACLKSLRLLGCPIFVVDSGSTDRTLEIATQFGAVVLEHPFTTHTQQWAWALENVPLESAWVLALDADQAITLELATEIRTQLGSSVSDGLYIKRRQVFRGRWIKHGGYYPKYLLKLFRRDKVYLHATDTVDHHFYVRGSCGKLQYDLIEANHKEDNIFFWIEKHNRYAALMAAEEQHNCANGRECPIAASLFGSPDQRVLWLKRLWSRLPLYVRPTLYFIYRYFLRTGFLDGKEGFIFHFLQAYWYRLLVDINLDEIRNVPRESETQHGETCQKHP